MRKDLNEANKLYEVITLLIRISSNEQMAGKWSSPGKRGEVEKGNEPGKKKRQRGEVQWTQGGVAEVQMLGVGSSFALKSLSGVNP